MGAHKRRPYGLPAYDQCAGAGRPQGDAPTVVSPRVYSSILLKLPWKKSSGLPSATFISSTSPMKMV